MCSSWMVRFHALSATALLAASGFAASSSAVASTYPDRMVRLVVAFPAGGPSDVMARQFAPALEKELGVPVIVENVGGAAGTIGVNRVLRGEPDGYQVLLGSPMELIQAPLSMLSANFASDDFVLSGMVINTDVVLIGRQDLPYDDLDALIAGARQADYSPLSYGSVGYGSLYHLVGEYFARQAEVELLHVPYRGGGPVIQDLMGGQIDLAFIPLAGPVYNLIQSGQVKPIALAGPERHSLIPDVPLFSESAAIDEFAFDIWAALAVPRGTPESVQETLNDALARALAHSEVKTNLEANGPKVSSQMTLAEMAEFYAAETERYQQIAEMIGVVPQ